MRIQLELAKILCMFRDWRAFDVSDWNEDLLFKDMRQNANHLRTISWRKGARQS